MRDEKNQPKPEAGPAGGNIPLMEETASVSTRDVLTGRVRVTTQVETFEEVARANLHSEDVEVIRIPINQPVVGAAPRVRTEGDLTIIPVLEEVMVVETRLMLKEELHVRKRRTAEIVEATVPLRRQTAEVERSEE